MSEQSKKTIGLTLISKETDIVEDEFVGVYENSLKIDIKTPEKTCEKTFSNKQNILHETVSNYLSDTDYEDFSPVSDLDPEYIPSDIDNELYESNIKCSKNLNSEFNAIDGTSTSRILENKENIEKKQRKRKTIPDPENWMKNIPKIKRTKGEEYIGRGGKIVEARTLKKSCKCRLRCEEKINFEERLCIFNKFWKSTIGWNQRKQFVAMSVKIKKTERKRPRNNKQIGRRQFSYVYNLTNKKNEEIAVCKIMFLNTLCISDNFVRNALKNVKYNASSLVTPDKRCNHRPTNKISEKAINIVREHILQFPVFESHYSRNHSEKKYLEPGLNLNKMYSLYLEYCCENNVLKKDIVKQSYYRFVFNTQFNYSFKLPYLDTCDDCDEFERKMKDSLDKDQKNQIEHARKLHHEESEKRYRLKQEDKIRSRILESTERVCTIDLQKCLPTPCLTNQKSFYLRKLWTLNFTISDMTINKTHCMLWHEAVAGRGSKEISSCILKWISLLPPEVSEVTFWSDNCAGQNRNINLVYMYMWILYKFQNIKVINHKYLLKGHTHMEVDVAHSLIEKKKRQLKSMDVCIPHDWAQIIRLASDRRPLEVHELGLNDFLNVSILEKTIFINRKRNNSAETVQISKFVHLQCTSENLGVLRYKTNFDEVEFKEVNLFRFPRKHDQFSDMPKELPCISNNLHPISLKKYNNLMELLQWIPDSCKQFYLNLPHNNKVREAEEEN